MNPNQTPNHVYLLAVVFAFVALVTALSAAVLLQFAQVAVFSSIFVYLCGWIGISAIIDYK